MSEITRRDLMKIGAAGVAALAVRQAGAKAANAGAKWQLALNTSTIRPASLDDKIRAAAEAGFDAIELWSHELSQFEKQRGSLDDLCKKIEDAGLQVVNIIGLWRCMPLDEEEKRKALDSVRTKLEQAARVGSRCIAAIPTPDRADMDVLWAARRYRELLELGKEFGVRVAIEFVGFFKGIHTLGQAAAIAIEANERDACIVADTFHLYRGGSGFNGVTLLSGNAFAICHFNDVPSQPSQFELKDSDRVYPGDGILPLPQFLRDMWKIGFRGPLSLELFNRQEWKKKPTEVARIGMEKMRAVIQESGVGT